jgi:hypothetical protein
VLDAVVGVDALHVWHRPIRATYHETGVMGPRRVAPQRFADELFSGSDNRERRNEEHPTPKIMPRRPSSRPAACSSWPSPKVSHRRRV